MDKLTLLIGGVVIAGAAAFVYNLNQQPTGHSMTPPDTSALEQGDPIENVTLPDQLSEFAAVGKVAFDAKCSACHGANATGLEGLAPPLVHKIYEPSHHSDESFYVAVQNGVRAHHWKFGDMEPVEGATDEMLLSILEYIRAVQREHGIF